MWSDQCFDDISLCILQISKLFWCCLDSTHTCSLAIHKSCSFNAIPIITKWVPVSSFSFVEFFVVFERHMSPFRLIFIPDPPLPLVSFPLFFNSSTTRHVWLLRGFLVWMFIVLKEQPMSWTDKTHTFSSTKWKERVKREQGQDKRGKVTNVSILSLLPTFLL